MASSSKELREFADECLGWAQTARTGRERQIFLQMSRTWLWAAARLDGHNSLQSPDDLVSAGYLRMPVSGSRDKIDAHIP
jgi:hypothetical protein